MLRLAILSLLACAVLTAADGGDKGGECKCAWKAPALGGGAFVSLYGLVSAKVDVQSIRIFQLERRLKLITDKLVQLRNRTASSAAQELERKLNKIEGTGCERMQFACGGDSHECINGLLTCDGSPDCSNGADEDSKLCSVHVDVGSTWEGDAHYTACDVREGDSHYRITITGDKRSKYFPTRDVVKGIMTTDLVLEDGTSVTRTLALTGQWSPGLRKLVLTPPEDYPLKVLLACSPRYDYVTADCKIVRQATFEQCGTAKLTLVSQ